MTKKKVITSKQLANSMKLAIKINESKKVVNKQVKNILLRESANKEYITKFLKEGPMDSVWGGIKKAGSAIGGAFAPGQAGKNVAQDQQSKSVVKHLSQLVSNVDKSRQKFQSELLKDTEVISTYCDSVIALQRAIQQNTEGPNPARGWDVAKVVSMAQEKIKQLQADLQEEMKAIDSFLKSFNTDITTSATEQETAESGRSSMGRAQAATKTPNVSTYKTVGQQGGKK